MKEWWRRREDLDAEVQSLMGSSEFTVYLDEPNSCVHIMRDGEEFTSALYPFDDAIRDNLRQQAYLLNNGLDADERQKVKEANEKVEQYNKMQLEEAKVENHNFGVWEYKNRFISPQNTPMFIVPGANK
jgi:hypothetical protein